MLCVNGLCIVLCVNRLCIVLCVNGLCICVVCEGSDDWSDDLVIPGILISMRKVKNTHYAI